MIIAIGCDHAGFPAKDKIVEFLKSKGHKIIDCGCFKTESCDYPDYAINVANYVSKGTCDRGILICSTGVGMSMAANKFPGVRAAVCYSNDVAKLISQHNDANIICLGANFFAHDDLANYVKIWLETPFDSESERHKRRVCKIKNMEKKMFKKVFPKSK